jgi:hypothetical protein
MLTHFVAHIVQMFRDWLFGLDPPEVTYEDDELL